MNNIRQPFNLQKWIDENRHLLKPPVGNKNLYVESGDYIVMIVAGPNARKDYHYNETEELFYQIEGDIIVKTQQSGKLVEYEIKEGEMFLLPPKVPHSPVRSEGSIGLVIERKRTSDHKDGLMWFSDKANTLLYEEYFQLTDVEKDFLPVFKRFYGNEKLRTCPKTGEIMEAEQKYIDD
ncbi:MAG: 3-hydroxyanthranilate 3,4-dioxygenase [Flavobacteriales bacterium TMED123]|nr:MAG: 3-hydroxyanthranilate 3,4-dioxygenase [Flavobacteriales bacterium TMED123]|tara:strand:- start:593 stop:1129 length:537 start_codon:yes stop_codon:yes gene_type:complete